jgi:protein SCO1/2
MRRASFLLLIAVCCSVAAGAFAGKGYEKTTAAYAVPDVTLLSQDRKEVKLQGYLEDKPVVLGFIFTSCTTICPVQGAMFSNMQKQLGPDAVKVRFVSISIDPQNDTPERMKEFLERYHARDGWDFLTGDKADIDKVLQAFEAYVPNKMSHQPLTFLKAAGSRDWIRLRPFPTSAELLEEIRQVMGE